MKPLASRAAGGRGGGLGSPRIREGPRRAGRIGLLAGLAGSLARVGVVVPAGAQETAHLERGRANGHTLGGGRLTGPDRKDVTREKARDGPTRFLLDPKAMIEGGESASPPLNCLAGERT